MFLVMAEDPRRQFDFWLGVWEVREPNGSLAGRNRIERLFGDIGLHERWEGVSGLRGTSYNIFAHGRWHQTWVDSSGTLLLLDGGLRGDAMVLEGTTGSADDPGASLLHRISWSVMDGDPDRVRQHWEVSRDGGVSWETAFDGRYRRVEVAPIT